MPAAIEHAADDRNSRESSQGRPATSSRQSKALSLGATSPPVDERDDDCDHGEQREDQPKPFYYSLGVIDTQEQHRCRGKHECGDNGEPDHLAVIVRALRSRGYVVSRPKSDPVPGDSMFADHANWPRRVPESKGG